MTGEVPAARGEAGRVEYPHVTTDPATGDGQPRITGTGVRVTDLVNAYEAGNSPIQLQEYFSDRHVADAPVRHLTLSEVHAALAYYYDNIEAMAAMRAENERLAETATRERHAAILKHYLGT